MSNGTTKKEAKEQTPAPPTQAERMRYNQYVKKQMRSGGTPAPLKQWVQTQRGK